MMLKTTAIVSKKIRQSAEGEDCTMQSPQCNHNPEQVCLRHINGLASGKGWRRKGNDPFAFYGCQPCEDWYALGDADRAIKDSYALNALLRTQTILFAKGLLKVA